VDDYNGYANWGTWHIHMLFVPDTAEELGEYLATLPYEEGWRSWSEGADYVREQVEEWASSEPEGGVLRGTLMREGSEHVDWDGLARDFRGYYLDSQEVS
jgi:hypothetical protein